MCASTSAIDLRVLVGDEGAQLRRVGAVQELERHLDRGGLEPLHDLGGAVGAERLLEQLLGERQAALGDVRPRGEQVAELVRTDVGLVGADASSRAISAETPRPRSPSRWPSTDAARSLPSWISRMAALRAPTAVMAGVVVIAPPASRAAARRRPRAGARPGRRARRASRPHRRARHAAAPSSRGTRRARTAAGQRRRRLACSWRSCSTTYVVASSRAFLRRRPLSQTIRSRTADEADPCRSCGSGPSARRSCRPPRPP